MPLSSPTRSGSNCLAIPYDIVARGHENARQPLRQLSQVTPFMNGSLRRSPSSSSPSWLCPLRRRSGSLATIQLSPRSTSNLGVLHSAMLVSSCNLCPILSSNQLHQHHHPPLCQAAPVRESSLNKRAKIVGSFGRAQKLIFLELFMVRI